MTGKEPVAVAGCFTGEIAANRDFVSEVLREQIYSTETLADSAGNNAGDAVGIPVWLNAGDRANGAPVYDFLRADAISPEWGRAPYAI